MSRDNRRETIVLCITYVLCLLAVAADYFVWRAV